MYGTQYYCWMIDNTSNYTPLSEVHGKIVHILRYELMGQDCHVRGSFLCNLHVFYYILHPVTWLSLPHDVSDEDPFVSLPVEQTQDNGTGRNN